MADIDTRFFKRPNQSFKAHLKIDGNSNIIFSGKFGTGKTTFLNQFFKLDDEYVVFTINPISYSIASNEDIVKYIKYDILTQFNQKQITYEYDEQYFLHRVIDLGNEILTQVTNQEKIFNILFKPFIPSSLLTSPSAYKSLWKIVNKVKEAFTDPTIPENEVATNKLMGEIEGEESGLSQIDPISLIISKTIRDNLKENQKSVLVIDDVDRIDPEHVFRIMNVFAAHTNPFSGISTKHLEFDKIVLVCDIVNIRSLFQHKYGISQNFNGYIDKFYSKQIFHYDYLSFFKDYMMSIIETVRFNTNRSYASITQEAWSLLKPILTIAAEHGGINFRSLEKIKNRDLKTYDRNSLCSNALVLLTTLFGSVELFCTFLEDHRKLFDLVDSKLLDFWCSDFFNVASNEYHIATGKPLEYTSPKGDTVTLTFERCIGGYSFNGAKTNSLDYKFSHDEFVTLMSKAAKAISTEWRFD